jgi:NAD(P)-dependent dehydrogenase (short-subunit alcohol dehydrogenase family)
MKIVIVTGGSKGIGEAIVQLLQEEDFGVIIADIKAPETSQAHFIKTDVSKEASVKSLIEKTIRTYGRLDGIVNNAGILPDNLPPLEKMPLKTWNKFLETNLTSAFLTTKHAAPFLRSYKGAIVNIASTRALQSEGIDAPYSATKGGLLSLTHALAIEYGPDIRVNAISPGWINTGQNKISKKDHAIHPAGRVGRPDDIAHMASYLLSEAAEFITGQNFIVDGGMTVKMTY